MEKIYKKINLEQARNRTDNKLPYYEDGTMHTDEYVWGGFTCDFTFPKTVDTDSECEIAVPSKFLELSPNFPFIDLGNGRIFIRYKNMMMYYYWLKNTFIPSCTFYERCSIDGGYRKIDVETKPFIPTDVILMDELDISLCEIGEIACVTQYTDKLYEIFYSLDLAYDYILFVEKVLSGEIHPIEIEEGEEAAQPIEYTIPYIDMTINIPTHINDMGLLTPIYEVWKKNKKYRLGDHVIYDMKSYRLSKCNKYDLVEMDPYSYNAIEQWIQDGSAVLLESIGDIDDNVLKLPSIGREKMYFLNIGNLYYHIRPYFDGYYDEKTKETYFDIGNPYIHWGESSDVITSVVSRELSGVTESKLSSLRRKKVSADDYGNTLPFIVQSGITSDETEMCFLLGKTNYSEANGRKYCDEILTINFYKDKNATNPLYSFNEGEYTILTTDMIPVSACTVVEFIYNIGTQLDKDSTNMYKQIGISHRERYNFTINTYSCIYDENERTFKYFDIDLRYTVNDYIANDDALSDGYRPIYSDILYGKNCEYRRYNFDTYKDEALNGTQDITQDIDCLIDRGISSCFERHSILGEIKTFQDLENYRNQYFSDELKEEN